MIEKEKEVTIDSKEQVLEIYGELFAPAVPSDLLSYDMPSHDFYLERRTKNIQTTDPRFFLTEAGVVGVLGIKNTSIWDIQENEASILEYGPLLIEIEYRSHLNKDTLMPYVVKTIDTDNGSYCLEILPYKNKLASKYIRHHLDQKLKSLPTPLQ